MCEFKKRFLDRLVLKTPPAAQELAAMNIADVEFRYRERVAEILPRGEWANDPERELAEVALQLLDRQAAAKTSGRRCGVGALRGALARRRWPGRASWPFTPN